jgi:glutathione S-transferase
MTIVLHQFEFSHFNEKVRWALDFKGISHERKSYLPGPHLISIKKLSGQSQVPVAVVGGDVIAGSAAILDRLERDHPEPALYPADPGARREALAMQARFDAELGPATRTAFFSALVNEGDYLCAMFARAASAPKRALYRASFPIARGLIANANGVSDPANVERAFATVEHTLDELAERAKPTGYLVGDAFNIADLTAAALLAPLANPEHPDMARPTPVPASVQRVLARYASHPTIAWVDEMYARHRGGAHA